MLRTFSVTVFTFLILWAMAVSASAAKVTIYRDEYGIPHIYGETDEAAFFGNGYAQAEDHLETMMIMIYGTNCMLAEKQGLDAFNVGTDVAMKILSVPDIAHARYGELPAETRAYIEAFADGINHYIETHPYDVPDWVEPVTPQMILALGRGLTYGNQALTLLDKAPPGTFPIDIGGFQPSRFMASNQWALGPDRVSTGNAVVQMDPHLQYDYPMLWWECRMVSPTLNVTGASFYGAPAVIMGHNQHVAWSMTDNEVDNADLFWLEVDKSDPDRKSYIYEGQSYPFDINFIILSTGDITAVPVWKVNTVVGPVVAPLNSDDFSDRNYVLVAKPTMINEINMFDQFIRMNRATNIGELKEAIGMLQLDKWNIVAGDTNGTIYYVQNSRHPLRDLNVNYSEPVYLDQNPGAVWDDVIPLEDLVWMQDPPKGFLQNCNTPPWVTNPHYGYDKDTFPEHMIGIPDMNYRGVRALHFFDNNAVYTPDEIRAISVDDYITPADAFIPALRLNIETWRHTLDPADTNLNFTIDQNLLMQAVELLENWDRRSDVDSRAMPLWETLRRLSGSWTSYGRKWDTTTPLDYDDGKRLCRHLMISANRAVERWGRLDPRYGDIHGIYRGGEWFPCSGSGGSHTLRIRFGPYNSDRERYEVDWGSSYMMFVELSDPPVAYSMKPFGQNENPHSPHYNDLTALFARDEYKPILYDLNAVLAGPHEVTSLEYPAQPVTVPGILLAGWMDTDLSATKGGTMTFLAIATDTSGTDLSARLETTRAVLPLTPTGNDVFSLSPISLSGPLPVVGVVLEARVQNAFGGLSASWPYLTVR